MICILSPLIIAVHIVACPPESMQYVDYGISVGVKYDLFHTLLLLPLLWHKMCWNSFPIQMSADRALLHRNMQLNKWAMSLQTSVDKGNEKSNLKLWWP